MSLNYSLLRHVLFGKWLLALIWATVAAGAFMGWWRLRPNLFALVFVPVLCPCGCGLRGSVNA